MHSNNLLEVGKSSTSNDVSNMERKQYLDQIHELVQTVQTLLDANIALGNKQKEQKAELDRKIADLQEQVDKRSRIAIGVGCLQYRYNRPPYRIIGLSDNTSTYRSIF